jgi:hypothetical protein
MSHRKLHLWETTYRDGLLGIFQLRFDIHTLYIEARGFQFLCFLGVFVMKMGFRNEVDDEEEAGWNPCYGSRRQSGKRGRSQSPLYIRQGGPWGFRR